MAVGSFHRPSGFEQVYWPNSIQVLSTRNKGQCVSFAQDGGGGGVPATLGVDHHLSGPTASEGFRRELWWENSV